MAPYETIGGMDLAGNDWERLARVATAWRVEVLLDSQLAVATRGDLSLDRVQALEAGKGGSYRGTTLAKYEVGLRWAPGSVRDVLRGGEFTPLADVSRPAAVDLSAGPLADERKAVELLRTVRDLVGSETFDRAVERIRREG